MGGLTAIKEEKDPTKSGYIHVLRGKEEHIQADVDARAFDSVVLVETVGRLHQIVFLGCAQHRDVFSLRERTRANGGHARLQDQHFATK